MKYRLVFLSGSLAGRVREVDSQEIVLGRDPTLAQILFAPEERRVSRRHAMLSEDEGVLVLRDLDSSTGTFVDGEDVEEVELGHGDVFELGQGGPRVRVDLEGAGGTVVVDPAQLPTAEVPESLDESEAAPVPPGTRLRFTFEDGARKGQSLVQAGASVRIGRATGNAIATPDDAIVSAQHAKLVRLGDGYVLMDLESTNGTFLNERRIERARVRDGDVVGLGPGGPRIRLSLLAPESDLQATVVIDGFAELAARGRGVRLVEERAIDRDELIIGRAGEAAVRLDSPIVSKRHARLLRTRSDSGGDGAAILEDLGSANGTYVAGQAVSRRNLSQGDRFVVGPFELELAGEKLRILDTRSRVRLDARGLSVTAGERVILDDVSLALPPGSFTALIGPSGAGKSTLLAALSGARPASDGSVTLNGHDLYDSFDALKSGLGYVPQEDIVHRELSVAGSLEYTARLRLPPDTSERERERRVEDVLEILELSERRDTPIHRLSGGQRKRVSIAAELLTEPGLLFLDEPTSGLDPGLEEALMLLLRELAFKGKTIVLVTHTLDNIHLCDALALLVNGRLAFFGSAEESRRYFGIGHTVDLYSRLKEKPAETWQERFRESELHRRSVEQPLAEASDEAARSPASGQRAARPRGLPQLATLTRRYLETLGKDWKNAGLLVTQAPLIAGLIGLSLLYGDSDIAYTKPKNTILFLLALTAFWFGCSNAARELVKERAIYLRERMVNLGIVPYLLSKVMVLGLLALVQCVFFLVILDLWFGIPGRFELLLASMLLASLVGVLLGLCLSALATTADRAMTLLPILLIPQVLFTSPAVQMDMKGVSGIVARAMPTWWSFDLMRQVALAPAQALDDDAIDERLQEGGPVLMTRDRFQSMLTDGYPMFNYRGAIEVTWTASLGARLGERLPAALGRWRPAVVDAVVLLGFALTLLAATALLLRRLDQRGR